MTVTMVNDEQISHKENRSPLFPCQVLMRPQGHWYNKCQDVRQTETMLGEKIEATGTYYRIWSIKKCDWIEIMYRRDFRKQVGRHKKCVTVYSGLAPYLAVNKIWSTRHWHHPRLKIVKHEVLHLQENRVPIKPLSSFDWYWNGEPVFRTHFPWNFGWICWK